MRFYRDDSEIIRKAATRMAMMNTSTKDKIEAAMFWTLWTPQNTEGMVEYVPDILQPKCRRADCKKDPVTALAEGVGDCEELGAINASLLKAMGVPTNVVSYGELDGEGHVWVEAWDDENWFIIETTVPEVHTFARNQNPYEVLNEYYPVDRVRGY